MKRQCRRVTHLTRFGSFDLSASPKHCLRGSFFDRVVTEACILSSYTFGDATTLSSEVFTMASSSSYGAPAGGSSVAPRHPPEASLPPDRKRTWDAYADTATTTRNVKRRMKAMMHADALPPDQMSLHRAARQLSQPELAKPDTDCLESRPRSKRPRPALIYDAGKVDDGIIVRAKDSNYNSVGELHDRYAVALTKIADLKQTVAVERQRLTTEQQWHYQEVQQVRQNVLLDIVKMNESAERERKKLRVEKYYAQRYAREQEEEVAKYKGEVQTERMKAVSLSRAMDMCREDAEHYQNLNKVLDDDLDELRQIENDDAATRKLQTKGLPPAYGSLEDEEQQPPYRLHKDSGAFDVASFKSIVREGFMRSLTDAHAVAESARADENLVDKASPDIAFFVCVSLALADACRQLKAAIAYARDLHLVEVRKLSDADWNPEVHEPGQRHRRQVRRSIARLDYVADRVAKVILDLGWRVVSACELRPASLRLTREEHARVALAHKEVDECLLEAFRNAFNVENDSPRQNSILFEENGFLTQVDALRQRFRLLRAGVSYKYFEKALAWLGEQVEAGRCLEASARSAGAGQGGLRDIQSLVDGSPMSSQMSAGPSEWSMDDV